MNKDENNEETPATHPNNLHAAADEENTDATLSSM